MKIWFVHQNYPGQYKHLARYFAERHDCEVIGIGESNRMEIPGVKQFTYKAPRGASASTHGYIRGLEAAVRRGQQSARLALDLKNRGLMPDIVCSHPGWGDTLYYKEIFPDAKFLSYFEFYYRPSGSDVGFDKEFTSVSLDDVCRVRTKNTVNHLTMEIADRGVSPTKWQHSQFPEDYQKKISVIHDGIDTQMVGPNPDATVKVGRDNRTIKKGEEIVTFVARNLEPYRGFHIYMRALPELMRRRPNARFFIIGGNEVSYGRSPPDGGTYRDLLLKEVGSQLDPERLHFFGRVSYANFLSVLQLSSVHVYLTYPFVLSWSLLEAMGCACTVVASRTPPVEEVITDSDNGLLFDFFSPDELCESVCRALDDQELSSRLGQAARQTVVENYDLSTVCLPKQVSLIEQVLNGSINTVE